MVRTLHGGAASSIQLTWGQAVLSGPIFSDPSLSGAHESCLVSDLGVRRFVPESPKPRVSSESDSAALAPLQQDFRGSEARLVHQLVQKRSAQVLTRQPRERSEGVWQVRMPLGGGPATTCYATTTVQSRVPGATPPTTERDGIEGFVDSVAQEVAGLGIGVTIVDRGGAHRVPLRALVGARGVHPVGRGGEDAIEPSRVVSSSCARQASSRWKRWSGSLKSRPAM